MEILGDDALEHLLQAGRLRLEHKQASLEELTLARSPSYARGSATDLTVTATRETSVDEASRLAIAP
jgi:hypothetical protein